MQSFLILALATLAPLVAAQQSAYGQCGGTGYTGSTTCVSGYSCTKINEYYSQCTPGTVSTTSASSSPSNAAGCSGTLTKFKYFGVNEAGAEFGTAVPGQLGKDYTWPTTTSIDYFLGKGFNTFRVGFMMERLTPPSGGLTGAFNATYLASLKQTASYITSHGGYAVLDPHNYGRYNGAIMSSAANFGTWCKNLASQFASDSKIIFDTNNEYHDMDQQLVFDLNQACINGIRAAGAKSQLILVEGNSWTGAWTWVSSGNAASLINLKDPNNNMAYEMHQYLDSDGSGTSATCVSSTIGAERLAAATAWLKANGKKGFLGEIGGGSNDACINAVKGALCSMQQSGVWIGALWWAAGPWWADYFQSIEPPNGAAISRILPEALLPFL
ncbi:Similar to Probable endo-beta-1,4-glucanase B; acc. no. Q96WQ8 [Pyronema omphalodes CBS 100304]|uniref:cellulase n=1 Tax=Pyronema omphalodes (strain CBS 100304) TaxID=1076935 RepID=U4L5U4_PYROM|nr:Similar to Probable endo-beta-1,4-glucanase B; acc. no. Q96WQ8 [Pyronema omphalodes CBS 100304]